jgi:hypothetical protein
MNKNISNVPDGTQIETMQGLWNVLRENGQVSNLPRSLPAQMVSISLDLIFV